MELGAGTGAVTRALLDGGVPPDRLAVVEIVPDMARHLARTLPGVTVIEGDAFNLHEALPEALHGRVGTAICGIPLVLLPLEQQRRFVAAVEQVAPGRGEAGRHPADPGERGHEEQGVGQPRPVAVGTPDRVGEERQLPARARRAPAPGVVPPVEPNAAQRSVVLPGAGGSPGPVVGDVHLVDAVEVVAGVARQHARQPGTEAGPHRVPVHDGVGDDHPRADGDER